MHIQYHKNIFDFFLFVRVQITIFYTHEQLVVVGIKNSVKLHPEKK